MKYLLIILIVVSSIGSWAQNYTKKDIQGIWDLTDFFVLSENGYKKNWCIGATGYIEYRKNTMEVEINCTDFETGSGADELDGYLFYAGDLGFDESTNEVIHEVKEFSHPSLNNTYRRVIEIKNNKLRLIGSLGEGKKVIVEWVRRNY